MAERKVGEVAVELGTTGPDRTPPQAVPGVEVRTDESSGGTSCIQGYLNKGFLSNCCTFAIMTIGLVMQYVYRENRLACQQLEKEMWTCSPEWMTSEWVLAFGLFGFAGGITNWLAVKMLFDEIYITPWHSLYGSGVIPKRFKEIRAVVKNTIMKTFFEKDFLDKYVSQKMTGLSAGFDMEGKIKEMLESPMVDDMIDSKLQVHGAILMGFGLTPDNVRPMVKPFVVGLGTEVAPKLVAFFDLGEGGMDIEKLREEVDKLMTEKLQELTPEIVKKLMEDVIKKHLGWLIVWGNVFGGLLGLVSKACGYG